MASWYYYSVAALLLLGAQRFLYKVAAERHCRSGLTTAIFMGTVTLLSATLFLRTGSPVPNLPSLLVLALINSASFAIATIAHIEALRRLPAAITFPLTRLSLVVVVVVSVGWFGEQLSRWQWLGVLSGFVVVAVLTRDVRSHGRTSGDNRKGLLLVAVCIMSGAIAAVSSKLAAVSTNPAGFMALSYLLGTGFSLAIEKRWGREKRSERIGESIGLGLLMGILNFFGFYAFLIALTTGPLAAIALMTGMHFVIAIIFSVLLYRERLTLNRAVGIGLTLLAVLLLRQ